MKTKTKLMREGYTTDEIEKSGVTNSMDYNQAWNLVQSYVESQLALAKEPTKG